MGFTESIIFYGISCFLIGLYFRTFKPFKLKFALLDYSFWFMLIIVFVAIFVIKTDSFQQGMFTFAGVYLAFWIEEQVNKREERKKLRYFLGLIWDELRFNRNVFSNIEANFKFLLVSIDEIPLNAFKLNTLIPMIDLLKKSVHDSFITSGAMTTLTQLPISTQMKDDLFNSIEIAYSNIDYLKTFMLSVTQDFNNKAKILIEISNSPYQEEVLKDCEDKLKRLAQELMIAKRACLNAIDLLNSNLDLLGVKAGESELRESTLSERDRQFVDDVVKKTLKPEEIFQKN